MNQTVKSPTGQSKGLNKTSITKLIITDMLSPLNAQAVAESLLLLMLFLAECGV